VDLQIAGSVLEKYIAFIFRAEDADGMFLQNVGFYLHVYIASSSLL
jgi:hypothetical protein